MGFNRRKCIFCGAFLPKETKEALTVKCPACHRTMGICSVCGDIQNPEILHPFGVDRRTKKTIQVCCSRCFEEAGKKFKIDWVVSTRYEDASQKGEALLQSDVALISDAKRRKLRQVSAKDLNEVDPKNLESVIYYDELPEHFTKRAKTLFPVVRKLFPGLSLKDWINEFQYNLYPERELAKWEDKVKHYLDETGRGKVSSQTNKDIWARIVDRMDKENLLEDLLIEDEIEFAEDEEDIFEKEVKPNNAKQGGDLTANRS
jgi:hypothetical protein